MGWRCCGFLLLALSSAGPVEANVEHEIRILDEKEDVMFATKATTSRFGIASADWAIPAHVKSGHYTIEVQCEGLDDFFTHDVPIAAAWPRLSRQARSIHSR